MLWDGTHYVYDDRVLMERHGVATYTEYLGEAMPFESLCQALDFNESSGLKLEVLRVDITSVYAPDLQTQVVIMQSDGSRYLEKMMAHNHNAYLTPQKDEAMVFDNREQAIAFLRECGHDVANWIIKPV